MDAPHDDRLASLAKFRCDLVGARGIAGHHGEADHVARIIEIDILNCFIDQTYFPIRRGVGCDRRQAQLGKPNRAALRSGQPIGIIARIGIDQQQPLAWCVLDRCRMPNDLTVPNRLNKLHELILLTSIRLSGCAIEMLAAKPVRLSILVERGMRLLLLRRRSESGRDKGR